MTDFSKDNRDHLARKISDQPDWIKRKKKKKKRELKIFKKERKRKKETINSRSTASMFNSIK